MLTRGISFLAARGAYLVLRYFRQWIQCADGEVVHVVDAREMKIAEDHARRHAIGYQPIGPAGIH